MLRRVFLLIRQIAWGQTWFAPDDVVMVHSLAKPILNGLVQAIIN